MLISVLIGEVVEVYWNTVGKLVFKETGMLGCKYTTHKIGDLVAGLWHWV